MDDLQRLQCLQSILKYELLKEVISNLEYDNAFGGLSPNEAELLNLCREVWADCHMGKSVVSQTNRSVSPELSDLFWSRFEEKVDEALSSIGEDISPVEDIESLQNSIREHSGKLCRKIDRLSELASDNVSVHKKLLSNRSDLQKKLLYSLAKALSCERKSLHARVAQLGENIREQLARPSERSKYLRFEYEKLLHEKAELEDRLAKLSKILETYQANEKRYMELACRKADTQRYMGFIQHLKNDAEAKENVLHKPPTERRFHK